ncbi:MAG: ABC transporter permease [Gemmatimonadota bacterium]
MTAGPRRAAGDVAGALAGFVRKETHHILRDRQTLFVLLALPLVQVLLFGFVIRTDVENVRVGFVVPAPDAATTELIARFRGSDLFTPVGSWPSSAPLSDQFERGTLDQVVIFEPGFADDLGRGRARVLVVTDASDPNTGAAMRSHAESLILRYADERGTIVGAAPRIDTRVRIRFDPTLESRNLFVPGLIALVLTIVSALMTSIAITREKERGTMEVLLVSPLRPWQIIVGKVAPYLALAFANVLTALGAAWLVFSVPFRGSVTLLLFESLLFIVVSLALGVFISTRAESQRAAMLAAIAGLLLPSTLLSGMIFPISSMPGWLRPFTNVVPATWFIEIARGVMLRGVGLAYLWQETLILTLMAVALTVASVRTFDARLS